jgi:ABC-2 type transport system ATP-binding protein
MRGENAGEKTMNALVEAEGLSKSFGKLRAVDGITLKVTRGEVLGFLGPNGAGKSTTMRLLTGFLEPDSGRARIAGFDVHDQAREAKKRLGYLPEGAPLYAEMTPRGFLRFVAEVRGLQGAAIGDAVARAVDKTGLGPVLDQTIDTLSKGYKRRVGIAQAILHDPEVLIMDEPTDGLDPNQKHQVRELIAEMAREKAIIVSTHILEEVEAVCTRAVVINKGRVVADGTAEDLMRRVPYHGSVAILVAADKAEAVKGALQALAAIDRIETLAAANGQLQLRAVPKNGAGIVTEVASVIRQKSLIVDEVYVERGKLDDVFRQITTSDLDKPHA